jgi:hypothetical protein
MSGKLHAPAALPPGKEPPRTRWVRGWVGPKAGMDTVVTRKILSPPGIESPNPDHPARSLVAIPTEPSLVTVRKLEVIYGKFNAA